MKPTVEEYISVNNWGTVGKRHCTLIAGNKLQNNSDRLLVSVQDAPEHTFCPSTFFFFFFCRSPSWLFEHDALQNGVTSLTWILQLSVSYRVNIITELLKDSGKAVHASLILLSCTEGRLVESVWLSYTLKVTMTANMSVLEVWSAKMLGLLELIYNMHSNDILWQHATQVTYKKTTT